MSDTNFRPGTSGVVLIGFAEALSAPETLWSLVKAGFRVEAFSRRGGNTPLRQSRHTRVIEVTPPETDAAACVADVESILARLRNEADGKPVILFPLDDSAVWVASRVRCGPETGVHLAGPGPSTVQLALDKTYQVEAAAKAGFQVPPTVVARSVADVPAGSQRFPIILKPADAVAFRDGKLRKGRGFICSGPAELERALKSWAEVGPMLVQPFIPGCGEGVFGFSGAGGTRAWSGHRRLRMMNPHGSGSSACISREPETSLTEAGAKLTAATGWKGLFMLEFLRDGKGTPWFMEFNGRPWGSLALARRQGFEYPEWNARLALDPGYATPEVAPRQGEIIARNAGRELMHLLFVLKGPKSSAMGEWPSFWRALLDVLWMGSNHRFYNWQRGDTKVFFADTYTTLKSNLIKGKKKA